MNIETFREYCLCLPMATEDMAFGPEHLLLRVCNRIFACIALDRNDLVTMKCAPEYAVELRERHPEVEPAWHWNKKYWNQINLQGSLSDEFIRYLVRHSYAEVVGKVPRNLRLAHPEITTVKA